MSELRSLFLRVVPVGGYCWWFLGLGQERERGKRLLTMGKQKKQWLYGGVYPVAKGLYA